MITNILIVLAAVSGIGFAIYGGYIGNISNNENSILLVVGGLVLFGSAAIVSMVRLFL